MCLAWIPLHTLSTYVVNILVPVAHAQLVIQANKLLRGSR